MARYFYDIVIGKTVTRDDVGAVCHDDKTAVDHAWAALPSVLTDNKLMLPWQHFEIVVRREDDFQVARVDMTVIVETRNPAAATALGFRDGDARR